MPIVLFVGEVLGTIAFALSGALIAIERKMDVLGIAVLAIVTAVGGGITRDIIMGNVPPVAFTHPFFVLVAFATALAVMLVYYFFGRGWKPPMQRHLLTLNIVCDAVGLGVFALSGVNRSMEMGFGDNAFLSIFVGAVTGVGGGVLRDMMSGRVPTVLRREVYAVAAVVGATVYYLLLGRLGQYAAMGIGFALIVGIRLLAVARKLNLPILGLKK